MSVLAIANDSGSVGKTTCVVSLATLLAHEQGLRVRVVDLDQQANATTNFGCYDPQGHIGDVLLRRKTHRPGAGRNEAVGIEDVEVGTEIPNLTLVPGSRALKADGVELSRAPMSQLRLTHDLRAAPPADVTLIDCPGTVGVVTIGAIAAADAVITVTQPTVKEAGGISDLLESVEAVAEEANPKVHLAGIIPNNVPPQGNVYRDTLNALAAEGSDYAPLLTPEVRRSVLVPESYSHGTPLPLYAPREAVTDDFRAVLGWLGRRGLLA